MSKLMNFWASGEYHDVSSQKFISCSCINFYGPITCNRSKVICTSKRLKAHSLAY